MPKNQPQKPPTGSSRIVEILHIDTEGSRPLYSSAGVNSNQKAKAQGLLKNRFQQSCKKHGGILKNWAGDGGFAFFPSTNEGQFGASTEAAKLFLKSIKSLNAQTARAINLNNFNRKVRIKVHRGEVFVTNDPSLDSADPAAFDDFIKNEKKFCPEPDELFITNELYLCLPTAQKALYRLYKKIKVDSIATKLFHLKKTPKPNHENIFELGNKLKEIKQDDWDYLKEQFVSHRINVIARNEITKGLILKVLQHSNKRHLITSKDLLKLTLKSLYAYLRIFSNHKFRLSFWRKTTISRKDFLQMADYYYPPNEQPSDPKRKIQVSDQKYKVCQAFLKEEPIATPCVVSARTNEEWIDFGRGQTHVKRHLASALQVPIYYRNDANKKVMQGVLCLDSDKPDMFIDEEVLLWKEELVGYLANISLSEILYFHAG